MNKLASLQVGEFRLMFEEMESYKGENIFYANMIHEFQKNVAIGLNKVQGSKKTRQYQ